MIITSDDKGKDLIQKAEKAFECSERRNVERIWAELAEYILPSQNGNFFGDSTKGDRKDRRLFDNTAPLACRDLAAAMHSTITNPASKWVKIRFREKALNDDQEANAWTSLASEVVLHSLADSNFDSQIGRMYQSYCGLATAVLLHDEVYDKGVYQSVNFASWHLSEVAYVENIYGVVDTIFRKFKLTLKQAYEKFGDNIGEDLVKLKDTKPYDEHEFYHCIYPRDYTQANLDKNTGLAAPTERPIASCYIMAKGNKVVLEDGYYEFPVYVGRWSTLPGEIYGFGPAHIARPHVLTLNVIERTLLKGLAKAVDPVYLNQQGNLISGDFRPGRIVDVRDITQIKEAVTQGRFDIGFLEAKELKDAIKAAFYIDKLLLPPRTDTGEMTAYEIQQRLEQMQVILGPPLSRLDSEVFAPLVMRQLKIDMRAGRIPPIPNSVLSKVQQGSIDGKSVNIDLELAFVNPLARSQQMSELRNITSFLQEVGGIAQTVDPQVLDNVDTDAAVEKMARIRDIPEELMRPSSQVQALRSQRQKQIQTQSALQAGESVGNIVKNVGSAQGGTVK